MKSLQTFPVLLDNTKKEAKENEVNVSVVIDELHLDEVMSFIHVRPDCVIHPFSKDPSLYCKKCFCCKCQKSASKCRWWEKHCSLMRVVNGKKGDQKRAEDAEEALVELKKLIGGFQKRAKEAEAAVTQIKSIIGDNFDGSKGELKEKCIGKGIKVSGKAGMKHKYACALLENYFGKD